MKTFSYEKPALIDMQEDSAQGRADCYSGNGELDCAYGSCVANAQCFSGDETGYCWNGNLACGSSSQCYTCCQLGTSVGSRGAGKGSTYPCNCSRGSDVAMNCYTGSTAGYECTTGGYRIQC